MQSNLNNPSLLLAARRCYDRNGTTKLVLVFPSTGARMEESEEELKKNGINLGDTMYTSNQGMCGYTKSAPIGGFQVRIDGNVAVVRAVPATLAMSLGAKVFESTVFGKARCRDPAYPQEQGNYFVDISLLDEPIKLPNGLNLNFEATNAIRRFAAPPPPLPKPAFFGNGFSQFLDNPTRPVDPMVHLQSRFAGQMVVSDNFPPTLPEPSFFANRIQEQRVSSPALSTVSSMHLPTVPRSKTPGQSGPSTPVPKSRSNTPQQPAKKGSPAPNSNNDNKFMFAGGRMIGPNGTSNLVLIDPKTGDNYVQPEQLMNANGIVLGDFLRAKCVGGALSFFSKAQHTLKLEVTVIGNVAYISNIRGLLIDHQGHQVFQSPLFTNALNTGGKLPLGKYFFRISLLSMPCPLPDGTRLFFEGTNAKPNVKQPPKPNKFGPKVQGAGFPVVGAGFAAGSKPDVVVGTGFKEAAPQVFKLKAVVMSVSEKDGVRTHYLWILDRQAEGRLTDKKYQLDKGHFFEGTFKANTNGKWTCQKYEKALDSLMQGGLDTDGVIWFKVKIEKFKGATGNMKYSEAQAKWIGKILDTEGKLAENSNGKFAKIKRKGVAQNDYVWSVVEVL